MKELGSLADVERGSARKGFFEGGGDGLVADVYLGYGLSRSLRRTDVLRPAGAVPAAAGGSGIRPANEPLPLPGAFRDRRVGARPGARPSTARPSRRVRAAIAAGDVYQVNLVQHLSAPFRGDPAGLARALAPLRPLEPRPLARRRLGDRLRLARALPPPPRPPRLDDADQGHAAARPSTSWPSRRRTRPST